MASTSESSTSSIIKSDRIGRTRYSSQYKAEVVSAYEQSGMSGQAFAEQVGVKYPTFAAWVAKSRKQSHEAPGKAGQQFLLAELTGPTSDTTLKVELPGGAVVYVTSVGQAGLLAAMLKTLA